MADRCVICGAIAMPKHSYCGYCDEMLESKKNHAKYLRKKERREEAK